VAILNYTTTVSAGQTAAQVQAMLGRAGAETVATTYDRGRATGVSFVLSTPELGRTGYVLPIRVDGVRKALVRDAPPRYRTPEQAERVAWRIAKDWLEAQLALVAAGLADLPEVMLPYQLTSSGQTVYRTLVESAGARAAIEAGASA
jgi:hypothetical protein